MVAEFSSKVSQARTEGRTDPVFLQWDPWEGQLQEGIVRKKDSSVRAPPEQVFDKSLNNYSRYNRWT